MEHSGETHRSLLTPSSPRVSRTKTGGCSSAAAHIITGVIGAGVLSLAWSVAQLGWIGGPLLLLVFALVTWVSSSLLADCYRSPDPETGSTINHTYREAVKCYLGGKNVSTCALLQQINMYGVGVAYTITAAISIRAIRKSNCYHFEGHDSACSYGDSVYMLAFGFIQIFCSQIPDFHNMSWLSAVAAIMSFCYATIGFGLGVAQVIENGKAYGSISGVMSKQKLWKVSQAIGDIAFAYPYSIILLEIEDTVKSPPPENRTMKKASAIAIAITTFFYLCCGCFGYAAFGDDTPGNLLTGFGFYEPFWLIDFANACIVLHLIGGYQIYSQPIFASVENWITSKCPNQGVISKSYPLRILFLQNYKVNLFRIFFRTAYVASTTGIAILLPYFNEVLGVLGAFSFWPLAIYFPVEMYFVQSKVRRWSLEWFCWEAFSLVCLLVSVFALVGSVEGLISDALS